jgi:hypothetical protein
VKIKEMKKHYPWFIFSTMVWASVCAAAPSPVAQMVYPGPGKSQVEFEIDESFCDTEASIGNDRRQTYDPAYLRCMAKHGHVVPQLQPMAAEPRVRPGRGKGEIDFDLNRSACETAAELKSDNPRGYQRIYEHCMQDKGNRTPSRRAGATGRLDTPQIDLPRIEPRRVGVSRDAGQPVSETPVIFQRESGVPLIDRPR